MPGIQPTSVSMNKKENTKLYAYQLQVSLNNKENTGLYVFLSFSHLYKN